MQVLIAKKENYVFGHYREFVYCKKRKNFNIDERYETGYKWTDKHQERSPLRLVSGHSTPLN